ncbi:hypothetical protein L1049_023545 [Liquidambar formosana]|uniref:Uncharacterized protein n=1 Tax=Liquidambar formosana TaxID=63359 RepID=A0AAP0RZP1_LIQFO
MDAKSLAKSKRAHSQHHSKKKPHPNQTSKAPSGGAAGDGNAKKPLGKQVTEKPRQSRGSSSLPSNWDRYEEEYDSVSEDPLHDGLSPATDVIKPKSKGADYAHLICEAQSQAQSQSNAYLDSFASLDDILPDFNQGLSSMLSVRGEGILSWIRDDNFIVEDKTTTSHEAPFFSLNLHTLAEQLAKVDLSQRLFIEEDLLPPELCSKGLKASDTQESDQMQTTCESEAVITRISDELAVSGFSGKEKTVERSSLVMSSDSTRSGQLVSISSSRGSRSVNQVKDDLEQFGGGDQNSGLEFTAQINMNSIALPNRKLPIFEAATAEAELDMLLDSFNETKFLASSELIEKSGNTFPVLQEEIYIAPPQLSSKGQDSSKTASITANFDDDIDDLLVKTSNLMNQNGALQPQNVKPLPLDDAIDDLLNETPTLTDQIGISQPQKLKAAPLDVNPSPSSHSGPKSKVLDDFDSWLDTI